MTRDDAAPRRFPAGDDAWRELAVLVHDLARRLKPQSLALARVSALSPTTAEVLRIVVNRPGVTIHEIAAEALLQQSNASSAVAELCRRGLADKTADAADRRRVRVHPTPRAIDEGNRVEAAWGHLYSQAVAGLDAGQVRDLRAAITALRALDQRLTAL